MLFLVLTVKTIFYSSEPLIYESAIKVDLVALPDKVETNQPLSAPKDSTPVAPPQAQPAPTIKEPAKPVLAEKLKKVELDQESINLEKTKKKQTAAIDRLKQMSALEEIEKQVQNDNKNRALEKIKKIKGNALSNGSELTGVTRLQHDNYVATVEQHIRQNWALPEWLARKNLRAQVRVRFDERGNVTSREIFKSSGNPSFDEVALATVEKSSPVPIPPEKFVKILNSDGILLGFPE